MQFNTSFILFPSLASLLSGIVLVFLWNKPGIQKRLSLALAAIQLMLAVYLFTVSTSGKVFALQIGSWQAPFGISFVLDAFSALMVLIAAILLFFTVLYSFTSIDKQRSRYGFQPLLHFLLMGIYGAFLTGDIFNLYVWFEVMLISSFVLLILGGKKPQLEGAVKYVAMSLLSSALFLAAIGFLYGIMGTLNMADIARTVRENPVNPYFMKIIGTMLFFGFGIKAAIFPMYFWLPASYHTPPVVVSSIFAGLLTKVGIYSMIRVFSLFFPVRDPWIFTVMIVSAGLTMLLGVLGPVARMEIRKILSFHIISQIGYILLGLAVFSVNSVAGAIYYLVHNILAKTNLFFIAGIIQRIKGSLELEKIGGLYRKFPFLSLLFVISAFALAGVPPLSGFWAKFAVLKSSFGDGFYWVSGVALFVSLLTLYSMTKIWSYAFWKDQPKSDKALDKISDPAILQSDKNRFSLMVPVVIFALLILFISFFPQSLLSHSEMAAEQLKNPVLYIKAVLGGAQ